VFVWCLLISTQEEHARMDSCRKSSKLRNFRLCATVCVCYVAVAPTGACSTLSGLMPVWKSEAMVHRCSCVVPCELEICMSKGCRPEPDAVGRVLPHSSCMFDGA